MSTDVDHKAIALIYRALQVIVPAGKCVIILCVGLRIIPHELTTDNLFSVEWALQEGSRVGYLKSPAQYSTLVVWPQAACTKLLLPHSVSKTVCKNSKLLLYHFA